MRTIGLLCVVFALSATVLVACGGDDDDEASTPTTAATGTEAVDASPASSPSTGSGAGAGAGGSSNGDLTAGPGEALQVEDAEAEVECDGGGLISVLAEGAAVTIIGHCEGIEVSGAGANVTAESADHVALPASGTVFSATEVGNLGIDGNENVVTILDAVEAIAIAGNDNLVSYGSGSPGIEDTGAGNSVTGR